MIAACTIMMVIGTILIAEKATLIATEVIMNGHEGTLIVVAAVFVVLLERMVFSGRDLVWDLDAPGVDGGDVFSKSKGFCFSKCESSWMS